jgi:hypothetical protein
LEAIGAISAAESKKAASRSGNYQDCVTAPISCSFDDEGLAQSEDNEDENADITGYICSAVEKVLLIKIFNSLND